MGSSQYRSCPRDQKSDAGHVDPHHSVLDQLFTNYSGFIVGLGDGVGGSKGAGVGDGVGSDGFGLAVGVGDGLGSDGLGLAVGDGLGSDGFGLTEGAGVGETVGALRGVSIGVPVAVGT